MDYSELTLRNVNGPVRFCPTAKQKLFLNTIAESNVTSILTRQQGYTTVQNMSALSHALKYPGSNVVLINHNNRRSVHRLEMIRDLIIDSDHKDYMTKCSKNRIELRNGSVILIASMQNECSTIRGLNVSNMYVAIDLMLCRSNLYNITQVIQNLLQMNIKISIGLMLSQPTNVSKKIMKIFNVKLTLLMTMLRYNSTFIEFPALKHKDNMRAKLTPEDFKREYELFPYSVLDSDPTNETIEP
jgi:hypothetical protein